MRDIVVLLMVSVLLVPLAFSGAVAAYLLWAWTSLVSISNYTYSFAQGIPYNLIFAIMAMSMILFSRDPCKGRFVFTRTAVLLVLLACQATISVIFGWDVNVRTFEVYSNLIKIIIFCMFMPLVLTTRARIHAFLVVLVLGMGLYGWLEGGKTVVSLGSHKITGVLKFGDNNQLGLVILMTLPLTLYLISYSRSYWVRMGLLGAFFLSFAAVIGTRSRGALLALVALGGWVALTGRQRVKTIMVVVVLAFGVYAFAPSDWTERMTTVKSAGGDSSFMTRVVAWKVCSAIALDNPFTGGGFRAVQTQPVWASYRDTDGLLGFIDTPERPVYFFAAHSIYFEALGDMGFVGLFLFLAVMLNVFINRLQIRRQIGADRKDLYWARDLADMIAASMLCYLIGGAALSLAYLEIPYMLAMTMEVLRSCVVAMVSSSPVHERGKPGPSGARS